MQKIELLVCGNWLQLLLLNELTQNYRGEQYTSICLWSSELGRCLAGGGGVHVEGPCSVFFQMEGWAAAFITTDGQDVKQLIQS